MNIVYLTDEKIKFEETQKHFEDAASWAKDHCDSFVNWDITDVSDLSVKYDCIASYHFKNDRDAIVFTLKWQ